jgi:hypothetical protein
MNSRGHNDTYSDGDPTYHDSQGHIFFFDDFLPEMIRGKPIDDEKGNPKDKNPHKGVHQGTEKRPEFNLVNHFSFSCIVLWTWDLRPATQSGNSLSSKHLAHFKPAT